MNPIILEDDNFYKFDIWINKCGGKKYRIQLTNKKYYSKTFDTEEECTMELKKILGYEKYIKKSIEAYNKNYYNKLINMLNGYEKTIFEYVYIVFKSIKNINKNRCKQSHIDKIKEITIKDLYYQLCKQHFKCYFSNMNFSINQNFLKPSIDRYNTEKPYIKDNIVITLRIVNFLKNCYPIEEFKRGIISIATEQLQDNFVSYNSLLGGSDKKHLINITNKYKFLDLKKPIQMSSNQALIYYTIMENNNEYIKNKELCDLIKCKYSIDLGRGIIARIFNIFEKKKYAIIDKTSKCFRYKMNTSEEIEFINNKLTYLCGNCKKEYNIKQYNVRSILGKANLDCNRINTLCTNCQTYNTKKCLNNDPKKFVWSLINERKNLGNLTKENLESIITKKCSISNISIIYKKKSGCFNQASIDRIDNNGKYNIDNTRMVCLMLNLGRNNFDIKDNVLLKIISKCYDNISNW